MATSDPEQKTPPEGEEEGNEPKGEEETPQQTGAPSEAGGQPPKKYAGKYESVEDLEEGYKSTSGEASKLAQKNKELQAQLEEEKETREALEEEMEAKEKEEEEENTEERDYSAKSPQEILEEVEKRTAEKVRKEVMKDVENREKERAEARKQIKTAQIKYPLLKTDKTFRNLVADVMDNRGISIEEAAEEVLKLKGEKTQPEGGAVEGTKSSTSSQTVSFDDDIKRRIREARA